MKFEAPEVDVRLSKGFIDQQASCLVMDIKARDEHQHYHQRSSLYHRSLSHGRGSGKRLLPASYFSLESLLLLVCLAATLLILPLILPPLPPPPFMLLLLPIGILAVLMILAFMPCNVRDLTYTYVPVMMYWTGRAAVHNALPKYQVMSTNLRFPLGGCCPCNGD